MAASPEYLGKWSKWFLDNGLRLGRIVGVEPDDKAGVDVQTMGVDRSQRVEQVDANGAPRRGQGVGKH